MYIHVLSQIIFNMAMTPLLSTNLSLMLRERKPALVLLTNLNPVLLLNLSPERLLWNAGSVLATGIPKVHIQCTCSMLIIATQIEVSVLSGSDPSEDCDPPPPLTESRRATVKSRKATSNRTNSKGGTHYCNYTIKFYYFRLWFRPSQGLWPQV